MTRSAMSPGVPRYSQAGDRNFLQPSFGGFSSFPRAGRGFPLDRANTMRSNQSKAPRPRWLARKPQLPSVFTMWPERSTKKQYRVTVSLMASRQLSRVPAEVARQVRQELHAVAE